MNETLVTCDVLKRPLNSEVSQRTNDATTLLLSTTRMFQKFIYLIRRCRRQHSAASTFVVVGNVCWSVIDVSKNNRFLLRLRSLFAFLFTLGSIFLTMPQLFPLIFLTFKMWVLKQIKGSSINDVRQLSIFFYPLPLCSF